MPITPAVLKWAREQAGYSLHDLEDMYPNLNKWENGDKEPTYPQLEKLAEKYKRPIAIFFFPSPPDLPSGDESFRTLGAQQLKLISPRVKFLIRKALAYQVSLAELNNKVNSAPKQLTKDITTGSEETIENLSQRLRDYLGVNLEQQCGWANHDIALKEWRLKLLSVGIYVFKDAFRDRDYSGFCLWDQDFPIIYINNSTSKSRQIFTLMHEVAHLVYRTSGVDMVSQTHSLISSLNDNSIEISCNNFAHAFLVPDKEFDREYAQMSPTEDTCDMLSKKFNVSREVILRKYLNRGKVSRSQYEMMANEWANEYLSNSSQRSEKSSEGNIYNNVYSYLGAEFTDLAFKRYLNNEIDKLELADHLQISHGSIEKFENFLMSR